MREFRLTQGYTTFMNDNFRIGQTCEISTDITMYFKLKDILGYLLKWEVTVTHPLQRNFSSCRQFRVTVTRNFCPESRNLQYLLLCNLGTKPLHF